MSTDTSWRSLRGGPRWRGVRPGSWVDGWRSAPRRWPLPALRRARTYAGQSPGGPLNPAHAQGPRALL